MYDAADGFHCLVLKMYFAFGNKSMSKGNAGAMNMVVLMKM